jgi:hypothetical protein
MIQYALDASTFPLNEGAYACQGYIKILEFVELQGARALRFSCVRDI